MIKAKQIQSPNAECSDTEHYNKYNQKMKKSITLSSAQMLQLIEDEQRFVDQIIHLNKIGKESMLIDDYDNAIACLQQAQKILQYAASCGKTIDRFLILATLHNQAAAYQKILELYKSYDYMEAILYNLKKYFQQNSNINVTQEILDKHSPCYKIISSYIHRKINTLVYSLQFAAISSQVEKHQAAIDSAKKALFLLQSVVQQFISCNKYLKNQQIKEFQLKSLSRYCCGIDQSNLSNLCKIVRQNVLKLRAQHNVEDKPHQFKLKKFSIGEVMQMQPTTFHQSNQCLGLQHLVSSYWFTRIALYTSIAYYTIATQLRLISKKNTHLYDQSPKFQKSKIFHLNSIKIALQFVPFFSDYHEHIIKSFKNNHQIDLNVQFPQNVQDQKIKQSALDDQSFILKRQLTLSQQLSKNLKVQNQNKYQRPRRISSQSPRGDKQRIHLNTKKKNTKSKSKENKVAESIEHIRKQRDKVDIRKSLNLKYEKKISLAVKSSRTKLGKPKHPSPQRNKKSQQKGKEYIRRSDHNIKKQNNNNNKKKILQQYMTCPQQGKKSINNNKRSKKLHTEYQKSKSKSKSKSKNKSKLKREFISPKGMQQSSNANHNHNLYQNSFNFNYNIGIRTSKHK